MSQIAKPRCCDSDAQKAATGCGCCREGRTWRPPLLEQQPGGKRLLLAQLPDCYTCNFAVLGDFHLKVVCLKCESEFHRPPAFLPFLGAVIYSV
jgi:hypothetical protein